MEQHYTAFISYRHQSPDQEIAKWLHTAIETYHIPAAIKKQTGRKSMGRCFRDAEELPLCPALGDDIERALDNSDWLIAVCSPRYLESQWCMREVEYFAARKGRSKILLVLVDGRPAESFPEMLCWRYNDNGELVPYQPLAAEARGETVRERVKKLRVEKYRLLAPILGVGFDDLRRRARQRRMRITATVTAAALVAAAGLGAYVALNRAKNERLRLEAEEQQRAAEQERLRAEAEQRRAAENSIGEYLERAAARIDDSERVAAANALLDALALSEEYGGLRREEIISALRRAMYIEPFAPIAGFKNQNVRLTDIVPTPDGRLAVGIENSNCAALIDLAENSLRYKVSADNGQIHSLCFSPDGSRFCALCDMGRLVTVWNTADGSEAFRYVSEANERYQIANAFFMDNDTLLVQDMEHFYRVGLDGGKTLFYTMGEQQEWYDKDRNILTIIFGRSLDEVFTLNSDDYTGTTVLAAPDRSRLLVGGLVGETGMVLLDGEGKLVTPLEMMPGTIWEKYAMTDDGSVVACVSMFGFVAGWDGVTGELIYFFYPQEDENAFGAYSVSPPAFSPDGKYMSFGMDDTLFIADARTGQLLVRGNMDQSNITPKLVYSSDGNYIFVCDQSLYIIDSQGRLFEMRQADFSSAYSDVVELGERMLITRGDGTAQVCCIPAASSIRSAEPDALPALCDAFDPQTPPAGNLFTNLVSEHELTDAFRVSTIWKGSELDPRLWYSTDGKRAALSHADGVIELFEEADGGRVSLMLGQLTQRIEALIMTSRRLAASDYRGQLMIYDFEKGGVSRIINCESPYTAFALNAREDMLMAMRADGAVDVLDIETLERLFSMRSPEGITDFGFAADGSCAVARTASGGALRAELWTDESALLAYAGEIAGR